jgi:hypothetical protein
MLDLPDQTAVTDRLDELAETLANAKPARGENRVTPAMANAIEKAMAGPVEQIEEHVQQIVDAVREVLDERLAGGPAVAVEGGPALPDAASIQALTAEMTALRRRISLRLGAEEGDAGSAAEAADDEDDAPIAVTKAPAKAAKAAKAPTRARGRRGRQIED